MHLICLTLAWLLSVEVGTQEMGMSPEAPETLFGRASEPAAGTDSSSDPAAVRTYPLAPSDTRQTDAPPWNADSTQPDPAAQPVRATPPEPPAQPAQPPSPTTEADIRSGLPAAARRALESTDPAARRRVADGVVGSPATEPAGGLKTLATDPSLAILPIRPEGQRVTVRQLLDEALETPSEAPLSGRPLTLLEALSTARDRVERLGTAHAYWRSVVTVAEYRVARDLVDQLDRVSAPAADDQILRFTQTRAQTALEATRLAAVEAQHRLAEAARLSPGAPLPLPADPPHVGAYQTRFNEIFSTRVPAGRLRLIHRTMPIRIEVIEIRASAVQAAEDVLLATGDAFAIGRTDLSVLLSAVDDLAQKRRAFLQAVCRYNHDIADYALWIAGLKTTGRALVATLIELKRQPSRGDTSATSIRSGVERATFLQGLPIQSGQSGKPKRIYGEPTLAPPRDSFLSLPPNEPASAPPPEASSVKPTAAAAEVVQSPADSSGPPLPPDAVEPENATGDAEPTPPEPRRLEEHPSGASSQPERPLVPVEPVPSGPIHRMANRLPIDSQAPFAPERLYPGLVDARAAVQAKHLAVALHWNRADADDPSQPIELADCLDGRPGRDAHAVIDAYWIARQRAAVYQTHVDRTTLLTELALITLQRTSDEFGAEAMLTLRLVRLSADAEVLEARARLLESQFDLTRAVGRPLDSAWLLPSTPPHAGAYRLRLDAQPASLIESWPLRRLAVTIPALGENIKQRAAAVVQADVDRADLTAAYRAGQPDVAVVLEAIQRQTEQTLGFLDAVTAYNLSIADYVKAVLPSTIAGDQLVATLVVGR